MSVDPKKSYSNGRIKPKWKVSRIYPVVTPEEHQQRQDRAYKVMASIVAEQLRKRHAKK